MTALRLYRTEIERSLRRRVVWVLLVVALLGIALLGVIAFLSSTRLDPAALAAKGETHPALVTGWWAAGGGDGLLLVTGIFLFMGALIGGAAVVGGEWRSGGVTTLLTWDPRRVRVLLARLAAIVTCTFVIGVALQLVALAAVVPSVVLHGSGEGADGSYAISVAAAILRIAAIASLAALLSASIASLARNTAAAIIGAWVWLALVENLLRGMKPWTGRFLVSENVARVVTWADLEGQAVHRSPPVAALLLCVYVAVLAVAATQAFRRADVATR